MLITKYVIPVSKFVAETLAFTLLGMFASYINLVDILLKTLFTGIAVIFVLIALLSYVPTLLFLKDPKMFQQELCFRDQIKKFLNRQFIKDFVVKKCSKTAIKQAFKPILARLSGPIFARIVARLSLIGIGINI
ncbi:MAG: hypothetical protein ATN36_05575 [Epulopiscium sp. Nele67-Bin005]|nr:MAG: hypothetical protein ATN36_05575 [Epulopiscium sp. Nele67-Bin005]